MDVCTSFIANSGGARDAAGAGRAAALASWIAGPGQALIDAQVTDPQELRRSAELPIRLLAPWRRDVKLEAPFHGAEQVGAAVTL